MKKIEKFFDNLSDSEKRKVFELVDVLCPSDCGMPNCKECEMVCSMALCFKCWMEEVDE